MPPAWPELSQLVLYAECCTTTMPTDQSESATTLPSADRIQRPADAMIRRNCRASASRPTQPIGFVRSRIVPSMRRNLHDPSRRRSSTCPRHIRHRTRTLLQKRPTMRSIKGFAIARGNDVPTDNCNGASGAAVARELPRSPFVMQVDCSPLLSKCTPGSRG